MTAFLQDEIALVEKRLTLTLGTKVLQTNFLHGVGLGAQRSARVDAE